LKEASWDKSKLLTEKKNFFQKFDLQKRNRFLEIFAWLNSSDIFMPKIIFIKYINLYFLRILDMDLSEKKLPF